MLLQLLLALQGAPDSAAIAAAVRVEVAAIADNTVRVALDTAYAIRGHQLLWFQDGRPTAPAIGAVREMAGAAARGLRPSDYTITAAPFEALPHDAPAESLAARDVALSRDVARLARHLARGRITAPRASIPSALPSRPFDGAAALLALAAAADPAAALDAFEPRDPNYWRLRRLLPAIRAVAGSVAPFAVDSLTTTLRPGDRNPNIPGLRGYLIALGDAEPNDTLEDVEIYDDGLAGAVEQFQRRHGLKADGVIGRSTRAALAVPLSWRARQAELTLERWRWFSDPATELFVEVNVADARLRVMDRATWTVVFEGAVVVGTVRTPTPLLVAMLPRIVFNPPWLVPASIARGELIPGFRADSTAFHRGGYELVQAGVLLPPTDSAFNAVGRGVLLRQRPGSRNALGRLKLDITTNTGIYLHDTPSRASFGLESRNLSHGCVRVEQPVALAALLLGPKWSAERIAAVLARDTTSVARLERPVEVRLMYATVVVDEAGRPGFRADAYKWDEALDKALQ